MPKIFDRDALYMLGMRKSGTAEFDEAVVAYREALKEQSRERAPLDWARTQNNLGYVLWKLAERDSGTARLEEAIAAYREALKERTRDRAPLEWAVSTGDLGVTSMQLARRKRMRVRRPRIRPFITKF